MASDQERDGEKKGLLSSDQQRYNGEQEESDPESKTKRDVFFSRNYYKDAFNGDCLETRPRLLMAALVFFICLTIVLAILLVLVGTGIISHQQSTNATSVNTPSDVQAQFAASAAAPAQPPARLASVFDYEKEAETTLTSSAWTYFKGGSMEEITLRDNVAAYRRLRLLPKREVNATVTADSLKVSTFGGEVALPVGFSPTASHMWAHPEGEKASARAARELGTIMIVSIDATMPTPAIAAAAPGALLWQQLYIFGNLNDTKSMIEKAERSGCKAIVLTIDKPAPDIRYTQLRGLEVYPSGIAFGTNYPPNMDYGSGYYKDRSWKEIEWLRSQTALPIVIKGVLTASEARQAVDHGASAIIVSNHGGRALDGVPATIDQLAEVVAEVKGAIPVYLDGGIRTGADVFKALALGADMVFVGRPVLWGLAHGGQKGVEDVISILKDELVNTMQLMGATNKGAINPTVIYQQK